jgi:hypothetical protein
MLAQALYGTNKYTLDSSVVRLLKEQKTSSSTICARSKGAHINKLDMSFSDLSRLVWGLEPTANGIISLPHN